MEKEVYEEIGRCLDGSAPVVLATVAMGITATHPPVNAVTTLYVLIIAVLGSIAMKYADAFAKWMEGKKTMV